MKAHIKTPDGVEVQIDGTPAELTAVLKDLKIKSESSSSNPSRSTAKKSKKVNDGLPGLIESLKQEGFFKKPQTLKGIRQKLKDLGHNYPITSLSGPMGREVRSRSLRRFKENKKYVYAQ
jgi:hypothetical protein